MARTSNRGMAAGNGRPRAGKAGKAEARTPRNVRGEYRVCQAPGCRNRYPAYVARQRFCSPVCRARAFYWDFKEAYGERYGARYERAAQRRKSASSRPASGRKSALSQARRATPARRRSAANVRARRGKSTARRGR